MAKMPPMIGGLIDISSLALGAFSMSSCVISSALQPSAYIGAADH